MRRRVSSRVRQVPQIMRLPGFFIARTVHLLYNSNMEGKDTMADRISIMEQFIKEKTDARFWRDMPMSGYTTLRLGGPAELFVEPASQEDVKNILRQAREENLPVTVVGNGSNLLVLDGGIPGITLHLGKNLSAVRIRENRVVAEAGCLMPQLARTCIDQELDGLVFAAGIPGSVGGGTVMNAGAYGGELGDTLVCVRCADRAGNAVELDREAMALSHRTSALQKTDLIVLETEFCLRGGRKNEMQEQAAELNRRRAEKQPLDEPSAGSAFKRPAGDYASRLVDVCGLKGFAVGGARVSEKHAGFLVNHGDSSADFLRLMEEVRRIVFEKTGVQLEPEIRVIGTEKKGN